MQKILIITKVLVLFTILYIRAPLFPNKELTPPYCAVSTAHSLATEAGKKILKKGGNAFDAAIAVTAVLAVVEPSSSGLGGGGFWLLHINDSNENVFIDGREVAPLRSNEDMFLYADGSINYEAKRNSGLAAGIPGQVAALDYISQNYGQLPLQTCLQAAIEIAENGFPIDTKFRKLLKKRIDVCQKDPEFCRLFAPNQNIPDEDFLLVQKDLAETLKEIALHGSKGFYHGWVAEKMIESVNDHGGNWTSEDLQGYECIKRDAYTFHYLDAEIITAPPPSSGGVVLHQIFNMLTAYDIGSMPKEQYIHILVECMQRGYHDRNLYLGDPDYTSIPLKELTSLQYARQLNNSIQQDKHTPSHTLSESPIYDSSNLNTTHFSILDTDGNCVSATLSINLPFGAGFVAKGTGVILNNEMDDFIAKRGEVNTHGFVGQEVNSIEPGKRMLSSMSPTIFRHKERVGILGTPGGSRIISQVLLALLNAFEGNNTQSWVKLPRFHHQYLPDKIYFEPGTVDPVIEKKLKAKGHTIEESDYTWGHMHAIVWDKENAIVEAASDPRWKSGKALVFSK